MMYIGICDDSERDRLSLQAICKQYFGNDPVCEIVIFHSGKEVLDYCEREDHPRIDLLFLDIEMPGKDGIEIKERVRHQELVWRIVFVTGHDEKVYDSFGQKSIGFEKKPVSKDRIAHWIRYVQEELEKDAYVELPDSHLSRGELVRVEDIAYVEAHGNYTEINLYSFQGKRKQILLCMKIGDLEKQLNTYPIVRVHKSYLVNLMNVVEMRSAIRMRGMEEEIPIGRKYRDEAKQRYLEYGKGKVRRRL